MNTIIIAEAGVNHNGDINLAYQLIDAAHEAKVDYIKFQTFITELIVDKSAQKAAYQKAKTNTNDSQFEMIKKLELPFEDFRKLMEYCKTKNLKFLTSTADLISLEKIKDLDLDYIKIASGDITNTLFLTRVAKIGKPVILSTGMATIGEIERALVILQNNGINIENIFVLHCNTEYPTPFEDVNLRAMTTIANTFKVEVGYSDHTSGIEVALAAVALGAKVIEKHFTLDKKLPGPDHESSLEPEELSRMVKQIRNVEIALSGSGRKEPTKSEVKNKDIVRKSLFSSSRILKGEIFSEDNILIKRPGDGIPAYEYEHVFGKIARNNIEAGKKLEYKDIQW